MDKAGLPHYHRHVLRKRLAGWSFSQIAGDPEITQENRGRPMSKQAIAHIEKTALSRLNSPTTVSQIHAEMAAERAARGEQLQPGELRQIRGEFNTAVSRKLSVEERKHKAIEDIATRMLQEAKGAKDGQLTPQRIAAYHRELARIVGKSQGAPRGTRRATPATRPVR